MRAPLRILSGVGLGYLLSATFYTGSIAFTSGIFFLSALCLAYVLSENHDKVVRIKTDYIRIPLLCYAFPWNILDMVLHAAMPVRFGGHPNKHRLIERDFYGFPVALFWAAWDGQFVEDKK